MRGLVEWCIAERIRRAVIVWACVAVLLGAAGFALATAGKGRSARAGGRALAQQLTRLTNGLRGSTASAPDTVADPSAPPTTVVTLAISVTPLDARVLLDGLPIDNPTELDRPVDNLPHELRAEAVGYSTLTRAIRLERDLTVIVDLAVTQSDVSRGR